MKSNEVSKRELKFVTTLLLTHIPLEKTVGDVLIAGGAIRDLIHGKPIKDIDIFISSPNWNCIMPAISSRWKIEPISDYSLDGYNNIGYSFYVNRIHIANVQIDFIILKDCEPIDALEMFPVAISQVGINLKTRKLVYTEQANQDYLNNTFTWYEDLDPSCKYTNKIAEKYQDKYHHCDYKRKRYYK